MVRNQLTYFLKVLVMMTGEFEYVELMYPETQNIMKQNDTWSKINDANNEIDYNHFPGLSHLSVLGFIIFVGIVMMNLLVAIAVNDIKQMSMTAKRDQVMSQAKLINWIWINYWVFRSSLPAKIQEMLNRRSRRFKMIRDVFYANNDDRSLPEPLKNELYDFCMR